MRGKKPENMSCGLKFSFTARKMILISLHFVPSSANNYRNAVSYRYEGTDIEQNTIEDRGWFMIQVPTTEENLSITEPQLPSQ